MSDNCVIDNEEIGYTTEDNVVNLVIHTLKKKKQVLIFNNSKRSAQASAQRVAQAIKTVEFQEELNEISKRILKVLSKPTKQCYMLSDCVKKGVAFHHAGLVSKQRVLVEDAFKQGLLKVISSTPTLAAGLNLPAYKVIIKDYRRYSHRGIVDIPVLEFHQMSGRAGRPGSEKIGKAVVCVKSDSEKERIVSKYVFGQSEEIISKLAVEPTLKMYILSLISMNVINTKKEIEDFFASTFYAYQYKDLESLNFNVFRIIQILKDYKFVVQDDDYYTATPLGRKISELYLNPDTANYFYENSTKFARLFEGVNVSIYDIYSLINFVVNTAEMKPLLRVLKSEEEYYIRKVEEIGDELVVKFDPFESDYESFLSSLKTSDLLMDWINEKHEDFLSDKYHVTPGELNYKIEVIDWLLYSLGEISFLKKNVFLKRFLSKFRLRFKYGIKSELISFITLKGIGRVRARKLYNKGFKKLDDLRRATEKELEEIIGLKVAQSVKRQLLDSDCGESFCNNSLDEKPKEIRFREVGKGIKEKEKLSRRSDNSTIANVSFKSGVEFNRNNKNNRNNINKKKEENTKNNLRKEDSVKPKKENDESLTKFF